MNTMRSKIMREAAKLFQEKGILATSIQDIVNQSGISKGSFYNHFKSKEELAFYLIKQKREELWETIQAIEANERSTDRERFAAQAKAYLKHLYDNRELLRITFQKWKGQKKLSHFLSKAQHQDLQWLSKQLTCLYGEEVSDYVYDCAALLGGIMVSYSIYLFISDTKEIDLNEFVNYLLRRMDGIIKSFDKNEKPIFTKNILDQLLQIERQETIHYYKKVRSLIHRLRTKLGEAKLEKRECDKIAASLDLLENEFATIEHKPREYIIEGMILYLEKQKIPGFAETLEQLINVVHSRI